MSTLAIPNSIVNGGALDASKVDQNFTTIQTYVNTNAIVADGTKQMTAPLLLQASTNPTLADHAARKAYVDSYFPVSLANMAANSVDSSKIVDGSIVNADVNAAAAIAYSKLALTGGIVNADVNAAAAVAYSKLNLAGSVKVADLSTATAELGNINVTWPQVTPNTANITGGTIDSKILRIGKLYFIRLTIVAGTASVAGVVQFGFNSLPGNFVGASNFVGYGIGNAGACGRYTVLVGTQTINLGADINGANFGAGASLVGLGFTGVFEMTA